MINQKLALSMLMNNQTIYYRLLKRFYDKYKDYPDSLKKLFYNNDINFYKTVHDVKGISLNLGASKLFELSDLINNLYIQKQEIEEKIVDNINIKVIIFNLFLFNIFKLSITSFDINSKYFFISFFLYFCPWLF